MEKDVLVAIFGFLGVLSTAWFGYLANKNRKLRTQAESEMRFQQAALSFTDFIEEWGEIHAELKALVSDTCIDRFMILRAWNGSRNPRWMTAVYQYRQGSQDPVSYIHFELDDDYVSRLNHIVARGSMLFSTNGLPPSVIKDVYEAEGVKHSAWFYIASQHLDKNPDCRAITYCSFATHHSESISPSVLIRCRILVGRMKGLTIMPNDSNA
jgi:hypothetical protein